MNKNTIADKIDSLVLYSGLAKNKIFSALKYLAQGKTEYACDMIVSLVNTAEERGLSGNIFKGYILHMLLRDQNAFSLMCENHANVKGSTLYKLAKADIESVKQIAELDLVKAFPEIPALKAVTEYKPVNDAFGGDELPEDFTVDDVIAFNEKYGCGDISVYRAFRYNSKKSRLTGVAHPDKITFDDLFGYESQIKQLKDNTKAFLKGYDANNVLLVGARGTGKSSSVKALVNLYFDDGLRLLEITKEQIALLPEIMGNLRARGRKFIVFIDDLSFDENEIEYKYMKSLLEGGSEGKPDNVLFYATSNRRHIIQEKWNDRGEGTSREAEVHTADTLNEKLSLSDRFGITITFGKPTPKQYVDIVKGIARSKGLELPEDVLEREALSWELRQKGRSGRTAKQFVNHMIWKENDK